MRFIKILLGTATAAWVCWLALLLVMAARDEAPGPTVFAATPLFPAYLDHRAPAYAALFRRCAETARAISDPELERQFLEAQRAIESDALIRPGQQITREECFELLPLAVLYRANARLHEAKPANLQDDARNARR